MAEPILDNTPLRTLHNVLGDKDSLNYEQGVLLDAIRDFAYEWISDSEPPTETKQIERIAVFASAALANIKTQNSLTKEAHQAMLQM